MINFIAFIFSSIFYVIGTIIWIIFAVFSAFKMFSKGYGSFWLWFVVSLLAPYIMFFVAIFIPYATERQKTSYKVYQYFKNFYEPEQQSISHKNDYFDENLNADGSYELSAEDEELLREYERKYNEGLIDVDEYFRVKDELISKMQSKRNSNL